MLSTCWNAEDPQSVVTWGYTMTSVLASGILLLIAGPVSRRLRAQETIKKTGQNGMTASCKGYLDTRILSTPPIALEQARKETVYMAGVVTIMYSDVRGILSNFDPQRVETIRQHEQTLDSLSHEITAFLAALSNNSSSPDIIYEVPGLIHLVSTLEHIGDVCEDILDCTVSRKEAGIVFSDEAMAELLILADLVSCTISQTERIIASGEICSRDDLSASKAEIGSYHDKMQQSHFTRICTGTCPPRSALLFQEITSSCMRVAELCWSVMRMQLRRQV
jgi:phosphate:Na+ symporter